MGAKIVEIKKEEKMRKHCFGQERQNGNGNSFLFETWVGACLDLFLINPLIKKNDDAENHLE